MPLTAVASRAELAAPVADDDRQVSQAGVRRAEVPATLHATFQVVSARNLHRQRALVHCWVIEAARLALHHVYAPTVLPLRGTLPPLGEDRTSVKWLQEETEFRRCQLLIDQVGSSLPGVVRAGIAAYVAVDGDLLAIPLRPT